MYATGRKWRKHAQSSIPLGYAWYERAKYVPSKGVVEQCRNEYQRMRCICYFFQNSILHRALTTLGTNSYTNENPPFINLILLVYTVGVQMTPEIGQNKCLPPHPGSMKKHYAYIYIG